MQYWYFVDLCLDFVGISKSTDIVCLFILRTYVTMAVFACTFLVVGVVFLLVVAEKCVVSKYCVLTLQGLKNV